MPKLNLKTISDKLLGAGIFLLAAGLPFSLSIMTSGILFLLLVLIMKVFLGEVKIRSTGLEKPLFLFFAFYFISAFLSPDSSKSIAYIFRKFWYILAMYEVYYLFEERDMNRFFRTLVWSTAILAIFSAGQALIGLNFALEFSIGDNFRLKAPQLFRVFENSSLHLYHATGLFGSPMTFGGQMLMLVFVVFAFFEKKWQSWTASAAFLLSFSYSVWFGFTFAASYYYHKVRKKPLKSVLGIFLFIILVISIPGNYSKLSNLLKDRIESWKVSASFHAENPWFGVGPGGFDDFVKANPEAFPETFTASTPHSESMYLRKLVCGGVFSFVTFLYLILVASKRFGGVSRLMKERWKRFYYASCTGLGAIMLAGFFHTYLSTPVNAVLIWTLAGVILKLKDSSWSHSMLIPSQDID